MFTRLHHFLFVGRNNTSTQHPVIHWFSRQVSYFVICLRQSCQRLSLARLQLWHLQAVFFLSSEPLNALFLFSSIYQVTGIFFFNEVVPLDEGGLWHQLDLNCTVWGESMRVMRLSTFPKSPLKKIQHLSPHSFILHNGLFIHGESTSFDFHKNHFKTIPCCQFWLNPNQHVISLAS